MPETKKKVVPLSEKELTTHFGESKNGNAVHSP